jgi:hypothetical protein
MICCGHPASPIGILTLLGIAAVPHLVHGPAHLQFMKLHANRKKHPEQAMQENKKTQNDEENKSFPI